MDPIPDQRQFFIYNLRSTAIFMRNTELQLAPLDTLKIAHIDDVINRINTLPPDAPVQQLFEILDYMRALTQSMQYND